MFNTSANKILQFGLILLLTVGWFATGCKNTYYSKSPPTRYFTTPKTTTYLSDAPSGELLTNERMYIMKIVNCAQEFEHSATKEKYVVRKLISEYSCECNDYNQYKTQYYIFLHLLNSNKAIYGNTKLHIEKPSKNPISISARLNKKIRRVFKNEGIEKDTPEYEKALAQMPIVDQFYIGEYSDKNGIIEVNLTIPYCVSSYNGEEYKISVMDKKIGTVPFAFYDSLKMMQILVKDSESPNDSLGELARCLEFSKTIEADSRCVPKYRIQSDDRLQLTLVKDAQLRRTPIATQDRFDRYDPKQVISYDLVFKRDSMFRPIYLIDPPRSKRKNEKGFSFDLYKRIKVID